jgi:hypothetical protein
MFVEYLGGKMRSQDDYQSNTGKRSVPRKKGHAMRDAFGDKKSKRRVSYSELKRVAVTSPNNASYD